jgi:hypothetical protein
MSDHEPNSTDSGGSQADAAVNNVNSTPASQEGSVEPPLISIQKRNIYGGFFIHVRSLQLID